MISRYKPFIAIIFLIGFILPYQAHSQWAQSELNLSYKYSPNAEYKLQCQPLVGKDSLTLLVQFEVKNKSYQLYNFNFDFFQPESLTTKLTTPIPKQQVDSIYLGSNKKSYDFKFTLPSNNNPWIVIRVFNKSNGHNYYFEFPVQFNSPNFILHRDNQPWVAPYSNIYHKFSAPKPLTVFYYNYEFANALPPMVTSTSLPEKSLVIDSTFNIEGEQSFHLTNKGLYFLQTDTSKVTGRGLLITEKYYPKPARLEQLIKPLVYITTKKEKQQLDAISEKKEFDKFWLDLAKSSDRARRIIKEYYNRVEHANATFTTYKPGWKTDMGMIYIIFGLPSEVIKNDNEEVWVYIDHPIIPNTRFRFIKTNNVFSSSHYVLIRDKEYDDIWFRAVDLWRKGRF